MWFKKASARRQAIREDLPSAYSARSWWTGYRAQIALVAAVFFLIACALQFWTGDPLPYRIGQVAPIELCAPVEFRIIDVARTETLRDAARLTSSPVLVADQASIEKMHNQLTALKADIGSARKVSEIPWGIQARFPGLNDAAVEWMHSPEASRYESMVQTFMSFGILQLPPRITRADAELLRERHPSEVRLALSNSLDSLGGSIPVEQILVDDTSFIPETQPNSGPALGTRPAPVENLRQTIGGYFTQDLSVPITNFILRQSDPNFHYNAKLTAQLADRAAAQITPIGKEYIKNQTIVNRGELITLESYRKLREAQEALAKHIEQDNPLAAWFSRFGRALVILILTAGGVLYMSRHAPSRMNLASAWAVCGLLLVTLVMAQIIVWALPQSLYFMGLAPTFLTAIILVIAFNQRFALGVATMHALLVTLTLGQNIDFFLALIAGIMVFCFGLREIRTRGKLIEIGFIASAVIYVTVWALGLAHMIGQVWTPWKGVSDVGFIHAQSLWALCSGIAVAMFALAILPSVERVFHITTAMTLLELCDANKPLLRRLSQEAPGTFNHSLAVGIMAEAAGNAVGANGLLCRVGAYYHDIGKLSKPQYFIENQNPGHPNRHDKLSPAMSLLIIVGHVKDGIELAREYALPWVIHQFIAQHHGTTLVEYFFHAARKRAAQDEDASQVSETEFRYPGPKPQTPEAAIVMICDVCESMVRSIEEPTPGRIESAVHNIVMKRLLDSQFSECDLTLRDLSLVEETLVRTLVGIHHGRISYPSRIQSSPDVLTQPA